MICFIPTKGRPETKTYKLFEEANIPVKHFVEPQDFDKYDVPNKINIEQNDQGMPYVRNFMLDYAKKHKHDWIIVCDDDVSAFGKYDGKSNNVGAKIWWEIFEKAKKLPFELIGINYRQHAWHEKTSYSINRKVAEVCVLIHVSALRWNYRNEFKLKQDRDFVLQTIKRGNGVLKFNHYFFNCPNVGTNKGGLQEMYKQKKDEESAIKFVKEWHPFAELKKNGDRIDAKIDFKQFAAFYKKEYK